MRDEPADREGPGQGAGEGPDVAGLSRPTLDQIDQEFLVLKQGEGLTPAKLQEAQAVMTLMGESHGVRAMQRLLDDLSELAGDDAEALKWALATADGSRHPETNAPIPTLEARRRTHGIAVNTAKDRERRAVKRLYQRWIKPRDEWARAGFTAYFNELPAHTQVHMGSTVVMLGAFIDEETKHPIIQLEVRNRASRGDYVLLGAKPESALVAYGTTDFHWQLRMFLPAWASDKVFIHRIYNDDYPDQLRVSRTFRDGRAVEESLPRDIIQKSPGVVVYTEGLDAPNQLTWWWGTPYDDEPSKHAP